MGDNKKPNRTKIGKGRLDMDLPAKGTYWLGIFGRYEADGKGNTKVEWTDGKPPQKMTLKGKYRGKP